MVIARDLVPSTGLETAILPPPAISGVGHTAEPAAAESDHDYGALFDLALSSQRQGDHRTAIVHYTQAIEIDPTTADAYINRGAAYESIGDLNLALKDLDLALARQQRPEAYNNRGNINFGKGHYDRAAEDYTKAIELQPANVIAHIYRGHSFRNMASYGDAIRDYNKALELADGEIDEHLRLRADAYIGLGIVHSLSAHHDDAIEHYSRALRLNSQDPSALLNRGFSRQARGDLNGAQEDLDRAIELDGSNPHAYGARADVLIGKGDFEGAIRDLDSALHLDGEFSHYHALRGSLHLTKGDLDLAVRDLSKALGLDPENTDAFNDRGVAYERMGDMERAIKDYDQALRIRPNRAAYTNRGFALLGQTEWDRAGSDLLHARNMGQDIVSAFRNSHGGVDAFERRHDIKLPQHIVEMVDVEDAPEPALTGEALLEIFRRIRESTPSDAFDELPADGSRNYKHYLYGWPKE